jgi:hypothetical protein
MVGGLVNLRSTRLISISVSPFFKILAPGYGNIRAVDNRESRKRMKPVNRWSINKIKEKGLGAIFLVKVSFPRLCYGRTDKGVEFCVTESPLNTDRKHTRFNRFDFVRCR